MSKISLLLSLLFCFNLYSQDFNTEKMDKFFDKLVEKDKVMASISIRKNQEEIYKRSIGYSNIEEKIPANESTHYRIGSISKTFMAVIILKLIEEDKLSMETRLSEYFPDFTNADSITIWHMLKHQSGLFNFTSSPNYLKWCEDEKSRQDLIDYMRIMGKTMNPGMRYEYSNTNYVLLSLIAEDIEGKTFSEILDERIVKPIELTDTYYGGKPGSRENEAISYRKLGVWNSTEITDASVPLGAGGIVSTPTDLNKFFYSIFTHEIVTEDQAKAMMDTSGGYGLGMFASPFHERTAYGHTGGIDGFSNTADFFPSDSIYIAYSSNACDLLMNDVMIGILSILFDRDYKIPSYEPEYKVSREKLDKYVGKYYCEQIGMNMKINRIEDQLTGQADDQPAFPLNASEKHIFKFKPAGVKVEFVLKEESLILYQAGQKFTFKKKKGNE